MEEIAPNEYLNRGVDKRRQADYNEVYKIDKNTDDLEALTRTLITDVVELTNVVKDLREIIRTMRREMVNANGFLAVIESNTYPETPTDSYVVNFIDIPTRNLVASQRVEAGTMVNEPSREGFTITGTYTDTRQEHPFDYDTQITSNLTLYTTWASE